MPQLDKLSIVTQICWLSLFFFSLYFFSLYFFTSITYKNLRLYSILSQNYKWKTSFFSDHHTAAYNFYTHLISYFFIKTPKIKKPTIILETAVVLCDANFVFNEAQEDFLYFHKLTNFLTIKEQKYNEI